MTEIDKAKDEIPGEKPMMLPPDDIEEVRGNAGKLLGRRSSQQKEPLVIVEVSGDNPPPSEEKELKKKKEDFIPEYPDEKSDKTKEGPYDYGLQGETGYTGEEPEGYVPEYPDKKSDTTEKDPLSFGEVDYDEALSNKDETDYEGGEDGYADKK